MRVVNRANTQAEAEGLIFGFQEMRKKGYQLENVSLHYRGNQGLDMIFRDSSGRLALVGEYAVVEAKAGSTGDVKTSGDGLLQGSYGYNLDRLRKYLDSSDPVHVELARRLLEEAEGGRLRSFITSRKDGIVREIEPSANQD